MNPRLTVPLSVAAISLVIAAPLAAAAPVPTPAEVAPPSIAQLCAATGIEEVDDLLADLATSDLVGELSPLLSLVVPESDTVELDASVQLEDIRQRLNCAGGTPAPTTPPVTTPPTTTTTPAPTPAPDEDPDDDFGQVGTPPSGGVATGTR